MTYAEQCFKQVVRDLVAAGIHPTMTPINLGMKERGFRRQRKMNTLNGQEGRWLRRDMGIKQVRFRPWQKREECDLNCCASNGRLPRWQP